MSLNTPTPWDGVLDALADWYCLRNADGEKVGSVCKNASIVSASDDESRRAREFVIVGRRYISEIPDIPSTIFAMQIELKEGIAYWLTVTAEAHCPFIRGI